jgi:hemoglobin
VDTLAAFLAQFFGGPPAYSDERGHPRLKMRHVNFKIGQAERDAWLTHMSAAIDEVGIEEPVRSLMRGYFDKTSTFLINQATAQG